MHERVCLAIHVSLLFLSDSDSLIQQTVCDPVTPGYQGESGGAMATGATVGESQLQRIIRDLHGTSALCVCVCVLNRLATGSCWLTWCDWRAEKEESERFTMMSWPQSLRQVWDHNFHAWNYFTSDDHQIFWENIHLTSCLSSKGVVEASVSMQRNRECVLRLHPSRVSFQFLRWIRGKFLMCGCAGRGRHWKKRQKIWRWRHMRNVDPLEMHQEFLPIPFPM